MRMNNKRIAIILALGTIITLLHYTTPPGRTPLHIFYRELYFIPIILAGLWGGKKTGLITSIAITLVYLPHVFFLAEPYGDSQHRMMTGMMNMEMMTRVADSYWGNAFQIFFFNIAGFFTGAYADVKRGYYEKRTHDYRPVKYKKKFLLCVEDSQSSLYAAKYFADFFGREPDVGVTLLWVSTGSDPDYFETSEAASVYEKELLDKGETLLQQVEKILVDGGVDTDRIQIKVLTAKRNNKISDVILNHLEQEDYGTIVVGKDPLSKSQEFLFGSVAVNLVRNASINVLTVKGSEIPGSEESHSGQKESA